MTSLQQALHQAHLARLARIESRAYRPAPAVPVVVPKPEQVAPPGSGEIKSRGCWFWILSDRVVDREPRVSEIQDTVCKYFDLSKAHLLSSRRNSQIVMPRHIGMYLARELTSKSFPEIGRLFHRDHTVPIFAARKIAKLLLRDLSIAYDVAHIAAALGERG